MKKILSFILVFSMLMSVAAYANIKPIPLCTECGGSTTIFDTREDAWEGPLAQRACLHGKGGYDYKYNKNIDRFYSCDSCGHIVIQTEVKTSWFCQGVITKN